MITLKHILPVTTVKKELLRLLRQVEEQQESIVITKDGKAAGVLMSADEYESLMETLLILSNPKIMRSLKKSEAAFKSGRFYTHEQVFKE